MSKLAFSVKILGAMLVAAGAVWAAPALSITFDDGSAKPILAEGIETVDGRSGDAARIGWGAKLTYATPQFLTEGFDIRLWVRHDRPIRELNYEDLVYLYHETADEKNRILLKKRIGTDRILFAMSDGTGRAKGAQFSGNWFAMRSRPLNWTAGSWHELRITAGRKAKQAALYIDGQCVATATGTEMPQALADSFWVGSLNGRSQMLGTIDDLTISPSKGDE